MPRKPWARVGLPVKRRMLMLRNMFTSLIKHERIHTTVAKARAMSRVADRMTNYAKTDSYKHRKIVHAFVYEQPMVWKLFDVIAPKYEHRPGGYTRVIKTKRRLGDYAPMAYVEFVDREGELRPAKKVNVETEVNRLKKWNSTKAVYKERRVAQAQRLANWKSVVVKNPYRDILNDPKT